MVIIYVLSRSHYVNHPFSSLLLRITNKNCRNLSLFTYLQDPITSCSWWHLLLKDCQLHVQTFSFWRNIWFRQTAILSTDVNTFLHRNHLILQFNNWTFHTFLTFLIYNHEFFSHSWFMRMNHSPIFLWINYSYISTHWFKQLLIIKPYNYELMIHAVQIINSSPNLFNYYFPIIILHLIFNE